MESTKIDGINKKRGKREVKGSNKIEYDNNRRRFVIKIWNNEKLTGG